MSFIVVLDKLKRNAPQKDEGVGEQLKKVKLTTPLRCEISIRISGNLLPPF